MLGLFSLLTCFWGLAVASCIRQLAALLSEHSDWHASVMCMRLLDAQDPIDRAPSNCNKRLRQELSIVSMVCQGRLHSIVDIYQWEAGDDQQLLETCQRLGYASWLTRRCNEPLMQAMQAHPVCILKIEVGCTPPCDNARMQGSAPHGVNMDSFACGASPRRIAAVLVTATCTQMGCMPMLNQEASEHIASACRSTRMHRPRQTSSAPWTTSSR